MGYGYNTPQYGYQRSGVNLSGTAGNPYYKTAQMLLKNQAGLFGQGLIQGESKADSPFTTLASSGATTVAPKAPGYTQSQVQASLAANPNASKGGYEGSTPMPDINATGNNPQLPSLYDYRTDPILQEINALSTATRQNADTGALALKKQVAVKYGDKQLGTQIGDPLTAQAANDNPYSVFAQLKQMYDTGAHNLDETLNKDNLFYSGARIQGQQNLANDYQGQLAGATGNEQDALNQIDQNRLSAILGANTNDINAQQNASDRAIQMALASGYSFGGYDGSGNPIFNKPGGDTPPPPTDTGTAPPPGDSASTSQAGLTNGLPVGSTNNALIYALLGRKMDPRYNQ